MIAADPPAQAHAAASPLGHRWVVVAPTYNHATALAGVLQALAGHNLPIIVVNDGAADNTRNILDEWLKAYDSGPMRRVVTHDANRGKAAALRTGFAEAARLGYTHALTIDTDGQHDVADLVALTAVSMQNKDALVIGARTSAGARAPIASRIGRTFSNGLVWIEGGVSVRDSQSGMRVYPLSHMHALAGRASRYAFETEVIVRAGWHGLPVVESPIRCIYALPGGRTTHFRLWRDTVDSIGMHAGLLTLALLPGPSRTRTTGDDSTGTLPRRLGRWFSPRRLLRMARGDAASRERLAASVGVGLLMATLPVYGVKTVVCLWLAGRFRLHPLAVVSISSLSTPPLGFVFVALSIAVGGLLLHGHLPDLTAISVNTATQWSTLNSLFAEWILGSVSVGAALGASGYALMRALLISPSRPPPSPDGRPSGEGA